MAISKGYTFDTTEQVTNAKLHALVDSATIDDSAVTVGKIADGAITNAKLNSAAGVALSKIATTDGKLVGGSSSNTAQEVTPGATLNYSSASGTIDVADTGVDTAQLADNAVTVAKLAAALDLSSNTVTLPDENVGAAKLDQDLVADISAVAPATGDFLLFGDITDSSNLKKATISDVVGAVGSSAAFTSSDATIPPSSGTYVLNEEHSLSRKPYRIEAVLVCTSAELGYAVGDEVPIIGAWDSGARSPFTIGYDATYVWAVARNAASGAIFLTEKGDSGNETVLTDASWDLRIYAW